MGKSYWRGTCRLARGDYFYFVAAGIHPCQSRGRGHVAGVICDDRALGGMGAHSTEENAERRTPNVEQRMGVVVDVLSFACAGISRQRADRMGASAHSGVRQNLFA